MQVVERRVRHESKILESKLVSEKRENYTNLNLMQLRGELIKTLQEKDESNKTRIILLLKNQEDCMDDIKKLSMLNCAKDEEYKNMLDTLKSTELEKEALIHECESYKGDLHLFSDKMRRK